MFFVFFSKESLFFNVGHSLNSCVLCVEVKCPLPSIKLLPTPDNNFAIESIPEEGIDTVHFLRCEVECIHYPERPFKITELFNMISAVALKAQFVTDVGNAKLPNHKAFLKSISRFWTTVFHILHNSSLSLVKEHPPLGCWRNSVNENFSETNCHYFLYQFCNKRKRFQLWKYHVTMIKREAYMSNNLRHQSHSLTSLLKNKSLLSAATILSRQPKPTACKTIASLDKLTCNDYINCGNCQDRFGQFCSCKFDSYHFDVKLKVVKKDDYRDLRLV